MTTTTTTAGLLPILTETSLQAQILIPLVASLAFGLVSASMVVLFVLPAIYAILDDFGLSTLAKTTKVSLPPPLLAKSFEERSYPRTIGQEVRHPLRLKAAIVVANSKVRSAPHLLSLDTMQRKARFLGTDVRGSRGESVERANFDQCCALHEQPVFKKVVKTCENYMKIC